jgi:hypothetical protein
MAAEPRNTPEFSMICRLTIGFLAGSLVLTPVAALAGYGKAGLWNATTTTQSAMQMDPETMAEMKKMGVKMPGPQTVTVQSCMTEAEVKAGTPPMQSQQMKCQNHITSQTGSSLSSESVCKGEAQGTGHLQMSWSSPGHYQGTWSFKGSVDGNPMETNSQFKADWVKADCGAVKPQPAY